MTKKIDTSALDAMLRELGISDESPLSGNNTPAIGIMQQVAAKTEEEDSVVASILGDDAGRVEVDGDMLYFGLDLATRFPDYAKALYTHLTSEAQQASGDPHILDNVQGRVDWTVQNLPI